MNTRSHSFDLCPCGHRCRTNGLLKHVLRAHNGVSPPIGTPVPEHPLITLCRTLRAEQQCLRATISDLQVDLDTTDRHRQRLVRELGRRYETSKGWK